MLLFNIKQVNLEHTLRRMKQNLKLAILIQRRNQHTLTEPNHATYNSGEIVSRSHYILFSDKQ